MSIDLHERYFIAHQDVLAVVLSPDWETYSLRGAELAGLCDAAGWSVNGYIRAAERGQGEMTQLGRGIVAEIRRWMEETGSKAVVVDTGLDPSAQKKLEKSLQVPVLDRTALILAIFSLRAGSNEGKLQVRMAQLQYLMPRLTKLWGHFGRIGGGTAGMRGKGETQIESDRRTIRKQIDGLRKRLEGIRAHRERVRSGRRRHGLPQVTLVGYTNVGKSTLLETLAQQSGLSKDMLFATLDPCVRRVQGQGVDYYLADTVGFIERLAPELVEAFHATLEIAADSDCIVIVLDASNPHALEHAMVARTTLEQVGAADIPVIYCLNKMDQAGDTEHLLAALRPWSDHIVSMSALDPESARSLHSVIVDVLRAERVFVRMHLPAAEADVRAKFYRESIGTKETWEGDQCILSGFVEERSLPYFSAWC